jgi:hypothetical protein
VETPRGLIQPPVFPGKTGKFTIRAVAPRKTGRFRLRVTLIQEGWRWLDELDPQVFSDCWIKASSGLLK